MYGGDFSEMTENIADLTVEDFTEMADNIADLTVEDVRRHFYNRSAGQASSTNNSLLILVHYCPYLSSYTNIMPKVLKFNTFVSEMMNHITVLEPKQTNAGLSKSDRLSPP